MNNTMNANTVTTILGAIGAVIAAVQAYSANGGSLADWKVWLPAAAIALFGYFTNKK